VQALEKAAALNEKDYRVWMNLAQVERWLGDAQKAKGSYAHALPLVEDLATRQPQDAIIQACWAVYMRGCNRNPVARLATSGVGVGAGA